MRHELEVYIQKQVAFGCIWGQTGEAGSCRYVSLLACGGRRGRQALAVAYRYLLLQVAFGGMWEQTSEGFSTTQVPPRSPINSKKSPTNSQRALLIAKESY